jgi:hypothetical protein
MGRNGGHQQGDSVAAYGELSMATVKASADGDEIHRASSVLEAINRLDPSLLSHDLIEELGAAEEASKRMSAAMLLWDRAEVAPGDVPLGVLGRLARPATEDWYVQAPAMAAAKQLLLRRRAVQIIFDVLAQSEYADDRQTVAAALLDVAHVDPRVVPRQLAVRLANDSDDVVSAAGRELVELLGPGSDDDRDPRSPFGL